MKVTKKLSKVRNTSINKLVDKLESDIEVHKLRYLLLLYIGQDGHMTNFRGVIDTDMFKLDPHDIKENDIELYNKIITLAKVYKRGVNEILSLIGFKVNDTINVSKRFFGYTNDTYLGYFLATDESSVNLKEELNKKLSMYSSLSELRHKISIFADLHCKVNSLANYYRISIDEYIDILFSEPNLGYLKFITMKDTLCNRLKEQIFKCSTGNPYVYILKMDHPKTYQFLQEQAERFKLDENVLLKLICYRACFAKFPFYLTMEDDQLLRYDIDTFFKECEFDSLGPNFIERLDTRCNFYNVDRVTYVQKLCYGFMDEEDKEKLKDSIENLIKHYEEHINIKEEFEKIDKEDTKDMTEEIQRNLNKIFSDGKITSLWGLKTKNPALYDKIRDFARKEYKTDISYMKSLGFEYNLQEGTEEYVEDNIHKYVYEGKYFCAHSDDPFYWMLERMCRPENSNKSTKESRDARTEYIESLENGKYTVIKANNSIMSKHRLYITPHTDDSDKVIADGRDLLSHFAFNEAVFLPSNSRKYKDVETLAHSLGLHVTEFIIDCDFDRRDANGNITLRRGGNAKAESMRGICKLYAPAGQPSFNTDRVVSKVFELVKDSKSEEKCDGKNIVKELKELLNDYAVIETTAGKTIKTLFLGRDSEIYELAEEIVHISKVETIVLLLHLGFNVYYETEEGAKYMEAKYDILNAILREEGLEPITMTSIQESDEPVQEAFLLDEDEDKQISILGEENLFGKRKFAEELNDSSDALFDIRGLFGKSPFTSDELKEFKATTKALLKCEISPTGLLNLSLWKEVVYTVATNTKSMNFNFDRVLYLFANTVVCLGTLEEFEKFFPDLQTSKLKKTADNDYNYSVQNNPCKITRKYNPKGRLYFVHRKTIKLTLDILNDIKSEPKQSTTLANKWIRNPKLVKSMKEFYDYKCQLCGEDNADIPPIISSNSKGEYIPYVEVHHIRELSASLDASEGTDIEVDTADNALVVCSYHHTYLHKQGRGLNTLVKKDGDVFITSEDESIKITTNKHLLINQ